MKAMFENGNRIKIEAEDEEEKKYFKLIKDIPTNEVFPKAILAYEPDIIYFYFKCAEEFK